MPGPGMSLFLAAAAASAASLARAREPPQPADDCAPVWVPPKTTSTPGSSRLSHRATEAAAPTSRTPEPTAAAVTDDGPGGEAVPDRWRGRDQRTTTTSPNSWENALTCGWVSGASSSPWTCAEEWHCETNSGHAVGCVSGTYSPLYTECYDYTAWTNGLCDDTDSLTGCCESSQKPACVTYMWSGTPGRSMFRCGATPAVTVMLDVPQYVLDASISASRASESRASAPPSSANDTTAPSSSPASSADPGPSAAGPAAHLQGLFVAGLVVFSLLLLLGCGCCAAYLRWAHRRQGRRGDRVGAANPSSGMEMRDLRRRGDDERGDAEAGPAPGPPPAVQGGSAGRPPRTDRDGEGWAARVWGRWKKAAGR